MINVHSYLSRLNVHFTPKPTLKNIELLMRNHLYHVPFENIDVIRSKYIKLDYNSFYEKIVTNNQGGFCYELNGLFYQLLKTLGYDAKLVAATVMNKQGEWAYPNSHAAIIVMQDQPYLIDVGFGDSFLKPLPISGETIEDESGKYRIVKDKEIYFLQKFSHEGWRVQYKFSNINRELDYFIDACHFNQTSPESIFTKGLIITIPTSKGRATITFNSLTLKGPQTTTKKAFKNKEQLVHTIREYTKIPINTISFLNEMPETKFFK